MNTITFVELPSTEFADALNDGRTDVGPISEPLKTGRDGTRTWQSENWRGLGPGLTDPGVGQNDAGRLVLTYRGPPAVQRSFHANAYCSAATTQRGNGPCGA